MGANEDGGFRAAMDHVSFRAGSIYEPPEKDSVDLDLFRYRKQTSYKVSVPWKVLRKDECLKLYDAIAKNSTQGIGSEAIVPRTQINGTRLDPSKESQESYFGAPWKKLPVHGNDDSASSSSTLMNWKNHRYSLEDL
jgi:hypothetical protein